MRAIKDCSLFDVKNKQILEPVTIVWNEEGRITDIGEDISLEEGVEVIDGSGLFVTPGLIHSFSQVGLREYGVRWAGDDSSETSHFVQPNLSVVDGVYPFDQAFEVARQYGVTLAHVVPGPENVISGKTAVIRTDGVIVDEMVVKNESGLAISLGEIPKAAYQAKFKTRLTRMRMAQTVRDYLRRAQYDQEDESLSIFRQVLEKEIPLYVRAYRSDDIMTAIRLKREFDIRVVLVHGIDSFKLTEQLKEENIPVIAGPFYSPKERRELDHLHPSTAKKLDEHGIKYSLTSLAIRNVSLEGALSIREGVDELDALKSLTLTAAEILGIDQDYGSLEVGKLANIVIWEEMPLELTTRVQETISHGKTVYKKESRK